jgi:hypothetical protein
MTNLFPAAQAVFSAFNSEFDWIEDGVPGPQFKAIAAALRAAADEVVPHEYLIGSDYEAACRQLTRMQLLVIAAALEANEPSV